MANLYKELISCTPDNQYVHERMTRPENLSNSDVTHYRRATDETNKTALDQHPIHWADVLTVEEERTLKKILAKDFPDAGRKRGAIMRYIKHFTKDPGEEVGRKLYNELCSQRNQR